MSCHRERARCKQKVWGATREARQLAAPPSMATAGRTAPDTWRRAILPVVAGPRIGVGVDRGGEGSVLRPSGPTLRWSRQR
jgi:hypothetical protein